ncbi:hypothetical protein ABZY68_16330 [Streptomyces sp. NPDC006482]|uniref:hypothetical protein n=1 Tax=Streptomyces sp. NPDC006482 TaxID=3154306 RepID=UPI0033A324AF
MLKTITSRRGIVGTAAALSLLAAGAAGGVALADDAAVKAKAPYAQASAQVNRDGTRVQSKGIKSIAHPQDGAYCVTFDDATRIDVSRSTPVATLASDGGTSWGTIMVRTTPSGECGNAADTVTVITGIGAESYRDEPFFLLVP